ncbi:MAG: VCBS repeat-containing protein [Chloroflexota bacterium]|nr:MAG: VCBS repeat-containing protein [Chloroflexota bacterium]
MKRLTRPLVLSILIFSLLFFLAPAPNVQAYTLSFASAANYSEVGLSPSSVAIGDFNRDGNTDLVITNAGSDSVSVLFNNGTGAFGSPNHDNVDANPNNVYPSSVAVGDFDRDGSPDFATANYYEHSLSVLLNNGNGTFAWAVPYSMGGTPSSVAEVDFNGDGARDLAVTKSGSDNVSVLMNYIVPMPSSVR